CIVFYSHTSSVLCHRAFLLLASFLFSFFFFFHDPATTEIYTFPYTTLFRSWLNPPSRFPRSPPSTPPAPRQGAPETGRDSPSWGDRKSTRLNSSHVKISYAVFCLKKKKKKKRT